MRLMWMLSNVFSAYFRLFSMVEDIYWKDEYHFLSITFWTSSIFVLYVHAYAILLELNNIASRIILLHHAIFTIHYCFSKIAISSFNK